MTPRIVLLPGLDGTGRAYEALLPHLAPFEASVIALAEKSTGYSADLEVACQLLPKTDPYVLVAESYAGPIGISIAAARPPGLVGLVLSTTFLSCPRPYLAQLRMLLKVLPPIRVPSLPFVPLLLNGHANPEARKLLRLVLNLASPRSMLARLNDVATIDVTAASRSIAVPTLYLRASGDRVVPRSAGDTIKRHIPQAALTELAGPHLLLQACAETAAQEIKKFAADIGAMPNADSTGPFTVVVADNFHYGDEDENYEHGKFETLDAAIAAAKRIVEESLATSYKPGMTADELYSQYTSFGDDPYITGSKEPGVPFSAWTYAKARCAELCT